MAHATWMCDNVLRTYGTTNMQVFKLVLHCIAYLHSNGQDKPLCQQYVCMYIKSYSCGTNCVCIFIIVYFTYTFSCMRSYYVFQFVDRTNYNYFTGQDSE